MTSDSFPQKSRKNGWSCPPHPFQFIAWAFFIFFGIIYFTTIVPGIPTAWQPAGYISLGVAFAIHFIVHIASCTIDPADDNVRAKTSKKPMPVFDRTKHAHVIEDQHCYLCEVDVGARSKHCSACNKCVSDFDHHCKWLNNCVGGRNYRLFIATLASAGIGCLVIIALCILQVVAYYTDRQTGAILQQYHDNLTSSEPSSSMTTISPGNSTSMQGRRRRAVTQPAAYPSTNLFHVLHQPVPDEVWLAIIILTAILALVALGLLLHLLTFHIYLMCKHLGTYDYIMQERAKMEEEARNAEYSSNESMKDSQPSCCCCGKKSKVLPTSEGEVEQEKRLSDDGDVKPIHTISNGKLDDNSNHGNYMEMEEVGSKIGRRPKNATSYVRAESTCLEEPRKKKKKRKKKPQRSHSVESVKSDGEPCSKTLIHQVAISPRPGMDSEVSLVDRGGAGEQVKDITELVQDSDSDNVIVSSRPQKRPKKNTKKQQHLENTVANNNNQAAVLTEYKPLLKRRSKNSQAVQSSVKNPAGTASEDGRPFFESRESPVTDEGSPARKSKPRRKKSSPQPDVKHLTPEPSTAKSQQWSLRSATPEPVEEYTPRGHSVRITMPPPPTHPLTVAKGTVNGDVQASQPVPDYHSDSAESLCEVPLERTRAGSLYGSPRQPVVGFNHPGYVHSTSRTLQGRQAEMNASKVHVPRLDLSAIVHDGAGVTSSGRQKNSPSYA